jgi:hypothetical protein
MFYQCGQDIYPKKKKTQKQTMPAFAGIRTRGPKKVLNSYGPFYALNRVAKDPDELTERKNPSYLCFKANGREVS